MSSPKKLALGCHKLMILSQLMVETLDEVRPLIGDAMDFTNTCKDMNDKCEELIKNVFKVDEVYSSTYIQDLTNKVDTCIRKNFTPIK